MTFNIIAIFYFQFQAFLIIRNGKPAPLQCVKIKADHTILRMYINNIIGQGGQSIFCGIVWSHLYSGLYIYKNRVDKSVKSELDSDFFVLLELIRGYLQELE